VAEFNDLYSEDPGTADAASQRLIDAMRRRRAGGTVASIIGGPFARAGQAFLGDADQTQAQLMAAAMAGSRNRLERQRMDAYAPDLEGLAVDRAERRRLAAEGLDIQRRKLLQPKPVKEPKPVDTVKTADELRREFQGQQGYKDFQQVSAAYEKIKTTSNTGAGDMSLIFGYMKLLDPNSTVREGEYATAAQAGSVPQTLLATYNKVVTGEKLAPETRKQFVDEATKVYGAQKNQYDRVAGPYVDLARKRGLDPKDVIFGYQDAPPVAPKPSPVTPPGVPAEAAPGLTPARADGKIRVKRNGVPGWVTTPLPGDERI
jgi:hypothetical protein